MYPVAIRPKTEVNIGPYSLVSNTSELEDSVETVEPSRLLLKYFFWTCAVGKLSNRTLVLSRLK